MRAATGGSKTLGRLMGGSRGLVAPATMMAAGSMATLGTLRAIPGIGSGIRQVGRFAGPVVRGATAAWKRAPAWSRAAAKAAGYIVIGATVFDGDGNEVGRVAGRRMNPLNHRALSRAIRRVKGAKRICRKVDSIVGSRARRASRGGRSRAAASCD